MYLIFCYYFHFLLLFILPLHHLYVMSQIIDSDYSLLTGYYL